MNYEELETLFDEWKNDPKHKDKLFIKDGIIELDTWKREKLQILFLAKEAYTEEDNGIDLREIVRKEAPFDNWFVVAQWIYAIQELYKNPDTIPLFPKELDNKVKCNELLRKIAFVNTKKSNGASESTYEDINGYAKYDKDRLCKQIDLINPRLVLCNYTFFGLIRKSMEMIL